LTTPRGYVNQDGGTPGLKSGLPAGVAQWQPFLRKALHLSSNLEVSFQNMQVLDSLEQQVKSLIYITLHYFLFFFLLGM